MDSGLAQHPPLDLMWFLPTGGDGRYLGSPDALAGLMAEVTGVPLAAQRVAAPRGACFVQPVDDAIVAQQQAIADSFARLRLMPGQVDVRRAAWRPVGERS